MCYGKRAKRCGTVKNYRYVESVADLRTAASRRVTSANPQQATAALADGTSVSLHMEGMRWARPYRSDTAGRRRVKRLRRPDRSANLGSSGG